MLVVNTSSITPRDKGCIHGQGKWPPGRTSESLEEWEKQRRLSSSLRGSPTCPPITSGLDRPPGTGSSASVDRQEPGALEKKGLAQVQSVWSQVSLPENEFLSLFQPLPHPAQPTTPPTSSSRIQLFFPGTTGCPAVPRRKASPFQTCHQTCIPQEAFLPQTRKKGLTNARWCVGCCLSLPGSRVPIQSPGPSCCVILSVTQPLWVSHVWLSTEENTSCLSGLRIIHVHIHEAADIRRLLKWCSYVSPQPPTLSGTSSFKIAEFLSSPQRVGA